MRLGLLGGAFDPVHNGHLFLAEAAREALGLDRVLFIPSGRSPHRAGGIVASAAARLAMLEAALADNPAFALETADLDADATGRTADLLPRLRERYPGAAFTFITGADSLARARWERLDEVFAGLDAFAIAPRGDVDADELAAALAPLATTARGKLVHLDQPRIGASSSAIRERLAVGRSVRYLVPQAVHHYLITRRPYGMP